jgi:hypothetical protein
MTREERNRYQTPFGESQLRNELQSQIEAGAVDPFQTSFVESQLRNMKQAATSYRNAMSFKPLSGKISYVTRELVSELVSAIRFQTPFGESQLRNRSI